jgi:Fe-S-cluster containining protein
MEKKSCEEKVCKRCGWCCTHLGIEIQIDENEDDSLRRYIFRKTGVIYLRKINKFFLAMKPGTAEKLKKHAKSLGIKAEILPNKLIYEKKKGKVYVYDYYLSHEVCPFYDKAKKSCLVYSDRPVECRKFPKMKIIYSKQVDAFVRKNQIDILGTPYEEAVEKCASFCKLS